MYSVIHIFGDGDFTLIELYRVGYKAPFDTTFL